MRGPRNVAPTPADKPIALFTCETGCVRSEIARLAAEMVRQRLPGGQVVRLTLGDASTRDRDRRAQLRRISQVTVLEGCSIHCATRMLNELLPHADLAVIPVDQFYKLEGNPFGVDDIKPAKLAKIVLTAAQGILDCLKSDGYGANGA